MRKSIAILLVIILASAVPAFASDKGSTVVPVPKNDAAQQFQQILWQLSQGQG